VGSGTRTQPRTGPRAQWHEGSGPEGSSAPPSHPGASRSRLPTRASPAFNSKSPELGRLFQQYWVFFSALTARAVESHLHLSFSLFLTKDAALLAEEWTALFSPLPNAPFSKRP